MVVELGPYPLCERCKETNGGLVATRHRQVHVTVGDRQACVDQGLAGVVAALWTVSRTRGCCEDHGGRAYVVPTPDSVDAAERTLTGLGLTVERSADGVLHFRLPRPGPPATVDSMPDVDGDLLVALDAARGAVAAVAEKLRANTPGIEHPRIREARIRLDGAQVWLTAAIHRWVSVFLGRRATLRPAGVALHAVLLAAAVWIGAWTAGAASGGSTAWALASGLTCAVAVFWPIMRLTRLADETVARRDTRLTHLAEETVARHDTRLTHLAEETVARHDRPGPATPATVDILLPADHRLGEVRASIDAVRLSVAALGVRYLRDQRPNADSLPAFAWLRGQDRVMRAVSEVDVLLRQASDSVRIWLEAPRG